jgi:hypothetical protein
VEVRHYSLRLVSSKLSKLRQKEGEIVGELRMQITESEDTDTTANSNNAVEEEDLGNMLSNLGFRLNDACLLSPGDQTRDHSRSNSPSSPRSGFLSPTGGSRSPSRNRLSPGEQSRDHSRSSSLSTSKSGFLSPHGGSRSHSRSRGSPTESLTPSESRTGLKFTA